MATAQLSSLSSTPFTPARGSTLLSHCCDPIRVADGVGNPLTPPVIAKNTISIGVPLDAWEFWVRPSCWIPGSCHGLPHTAHTNAGNVEPPSSERIRVDALERGVGRPQLPAGLRRAR